MITPTATPLVINAYRGGLENLTSILFAQIISLQSFGKYIPDVIDLSALVSWLKLISFFVTVGLSLIFMAILMKLRGLYMPIEASDLGQVKESGPTSPVQSVGPYRARWDEILKHMDSAKEAEWKFAVIEADKLADLILKRAGFQGDSMGERLMSVQDGQLLTLQDLWDAHKVRNQLAHTVDYFLRYSEAKQAIEKYERFLQEMAVI